MDVKNSETVKRDYEIITKLEHSCNSSLLLGN